MVQMILLWFQFLWSFGEPVVKIVRGVRDDGGQNPLIRPYFLPGGVPRWGLPSDFYKKNIDGDGDGLTPLSWNMELENQPHAKEISFGDHQFQVPG